MQRTVAILGFAPEFKLTMLAHSHDTLTANEPMGGRPASMAHPVIKFGTDGWRGVIASDFTFENVRTAATAIAAYLHSQKDEHQQAAKGVCIGYDSRFLSREFAQACAEVLAGTREGVVGEARAQMLALEGFALAAVALTAAPLAVAGALGFLG